MAVIEVYLATLRDKARQSIIDCGAGDVCSAVVHPGATVVWSYCGESCGEDCSGQLWVRLVAPFRYTTFPLPEEDHQCPAALAFNVEVGVVRCMPIGDEQGPPSDDDITNAALAGVRDERALRQAVIDTGGLFALLEYQPLGPLGGCTGGMWLIAVDPDG